MPQPTTFFLKQGNTLPAITATLADQSGNPVNLTGASVHFHMTNFYFGNVVNSAATVVNATSGQVSYSWQQGDTNNTGLFSCEWYVVFSNGAQQTFPYGYYNSVQIDPALNVGFPEILQPSTYFNTIYSAAAAPTALNGNNGDFWYNTANGFFYGPKANGTWPAGNLLNYSSVPLNSITSPNGNVNMAGFSFTSLPYISVLPSSLSQVPLTSAIPSGSTADVVDFKIATTTVWSINSSGWLLGATGYPLICQGQVHVSAGSTSQVAFVANNPSSTTVDVAQFQINNSTTFKVNSSGNPALVNSSQMDLTGGAVSPFIGSASQVWVPVWSVASGTAPVIGNGSLSSSYMKFGRMVWIQFQLLAGTTTTFGQASQPWSFTLPFAPAATLSTVPGSAAIIIGATEFGATCIINTSSSSLQILYPTGGIPTSAPPTWTAIGNNYFTWSAASTTHIHASLMYESTS